MEKALRDSTIRRNERIMALVHQHYEQGNLSRCLSSVYRMYIRPEMGISYSAFREHLKRAGFYARGHAPRGEGGGDDDRQMVLPIWEEKE